MTEPSFPILRVRGIPIGAHWTWLLVFAIVVWSLGTVLFPATYPGLDGATYLGMAVAAALLAELEATRRAVRLRVGVATGWHHR